MENQQKLSVNDRKRKIRERYKGTNLDKIDVILATPEEDIYNPSDTKRVAVYARVSTDDPNQTSSYELQKNHYQDYVSQVPNWSLVKIYADEGISGTSLNHRDAFKEMIQDCLDGKIDLIITKSVSRFARNTEDCLHYMRRLKALTPPVGIKFETEGIFSLNSDAEMILSFMATLAQEESHNKSEIMNASIAMRFRRGIFLTPKLLGYTHDENGNLIIQKEEAKIVKLIFFMFLYGYSCTEIAKYLTNLTCPTIKGGEQWSPSTIRAILENERHCGDIRARKTYTPNYLDHKSKKNNKNVDQYYYSGHHEAIISHADFNAVQKKLQNAKFSTVAFLPSLQVIREGVLKGFVCIHPKWAGFSVDDYYAASRSVHTDEELKRLCSPIEHTFEAQDGDFDFRGYEIVRGQFINRSDQLSVSISSKRILFGINAIRKLPKADYIELLIHPDRKLLVVRPTTKSNKHSLSWKVLASSKISPKNITGRAFLPTFIQLMNWDEENNYKFLGIVKQRDNESFLLYDLKHPQITLPTDSPETDADTLPSHTRTIAYPSTWANHFGEEFYLHQQSTQLHNESATNWKSQIQGIPYDTEDTSAITSVKELEKEITELTFHLTQEEQHG